MDSIISEFDVIATAVAVEANKVEDKVEATLTASNTTQTLAPKPIESVSEQTELDKVEAAALNVVHQIEEKIAIVEEKIVTEVKAVEGVLVEAARKVIHVHLPAGGGSVIKNPG